MRVLASHLDVDRGPESVCKRAKEVGHELRRQAAHRLSAEVAGKPPKGTPRQVDGYGRCRFIHWQEKTVAGDAVLCPERLSQSLSQSERAVFNRVMLIDPQVTLASEVHRKATVPCELLEHMVEEPDIRPRLDGLGRIEIYAHEDGGLFGLAAQLRAPRQERRDRRGPALLGQAMAAHPQAPDLQVRGELQVAVPVPDDHTQLAIDVALEQIARHQSRLGLSTLAAVTVEVRADEDRVEDDAL